MANRCPHRSRPTGESARQKDAVALRLLVQHRIKCRKSALQAGQGATLKTRLFPKVTEFNRIKICRDSSVGRATDS